MATIEYVPQVPVAGKIEVRAMSSMATGNPKAAAGRVDVTAYRNDGESAVTRFTFNLQDLIQIVARTGSYDGSHPVHYGEVTVDIAL